MAGARRLAMRRRAASWVDLDGRAPNGDDLVAWSEDNLDTEQLVKHAEHRDVRARLLHEVDHGLRHVFRSRVIRVELEPERRVEDSLPGTVSDHDRVELFLLEDSLRWALVPGVDGQAEANASLLGDGGGPQRAARQHLPLDANPVAVLDRRDRRRRHLH